MCATGCALRAQPRKYSRPARSGNCTGYPLGIPRVINVACDRALLGAYTQETKKITASLVRQAAGEVYGRRFFPTWLGWVIGSLGVVAIAGTLFLGWQFWRHQSPVLSASRAHQECRGSRRAAQAGSRSAAGGAGTRGTAGAQAGIGQCAARSQ